MIVHKSWIVNSLLSLAVALTCVVSDNRLKAATHPLIKAAIDNATHGVVGLFSALIVIGVQADKIHLTVACMLISSLIDVDHFIAAKSLKLSDATGLQYRPFLHNSMIPLVLFIILTACYFSSQNNNLIMWLIIAIVAFTTHHLRDANRRGLWFAPFGSTPALSDQTSIILTLLTPFMIKYFVPELDKYIRLPSPPVLDV